jgi:hypothetical protein
MIRQLLETACYLVFFPERTSYGRPRIRQLCFNQCETISETVSCFETFRRRASSQDNSKIGRQLSKKTIKKELKREIHALAPNLLNSKGTRPPTRGLTTPTPTDSEFMPRIAVPLMKNRVAPYFGCCDELLLLDWDGDALLRISQALLPEDPWYISRYLAAMRVQKLLCGGIWSFHKDWLAAQGIEVIDNQHGPVEEILREVLR